MRKSATQRKYGMTIRQIQQHNHQKVCQCLKKYGLESEGLSEFDAIMKLASFIAIGILKNERK